jgi:class 3 adenylate cyclase
MMILTNDLTDRVKDIFREQWTTRDGDVVPEPEDVRLSNDAVKLDAAILYADLKGSTDMVDRYSRTFAAEVYKAYLHCAGQIIKYENGVITAYDGDRIMAVFLGETKRSNAARCALKINAAVINIINPAIRSQYGSTGFAVRHVVAVDATEVWAARTGVWGNNDLVWVGPAANYAAKLCEIDEYGYSSYITERVYKQMMKSVKISSDGRYMWESRKWPAMKNMTIFRSCWRWAI